MAAARSGVPQSEGTVYAALLRGINVGSAKQLPMADLRELLSGLGLSGVRTHLRSGNAVFADPAGRTPPALIAEIEAAIAARCGFSSQVVLRDAAELAAVVAANPLPEAAEDGSRLVVAFLSEQPAEVWVKEVRAMAPRYARTEPYAVHGREIYVWHKAGISKSELPKNFWGRRMGVRTVTVRNWNTVLKLHELTAPPAAG